jgi:teichuronic acid biosynthesis glycosyltransferase TuaG
MRQVAISVVIPTFNSSSMVTGAVYSALAQSLPPSQVIVVDDGSTDNCEECLRPFADRILLIRQPHAGVAAARNTGLDQATGDFVAFLDADDVWHPRKLELQVRGFEPQGQDLGALGTLTFEWPSVRVPDLEDQVSAGNIEYVEWDRLVVKNCLTTSSMMVRRDVLLRAGPFDTSLHGPEDHDLWLRVAEVSLVGVLRIPLTGYRDTSGSLSKHAKKMEEGMARILDKLDRRDVWRGRWLLRRAARAYVSYSCGYMYAAAGDSAKGFRRVVRSLIVYPLPYEQGTMRTRFARLKLVVGLFLTLSTKRKTQSSS